MSVPDWLLELLAVVALAVAAMSAGQLAVMRAGIHRGAMDADIALFHLLLGIAMAGLLVAGLHTLPNTAWDIVFAVATAWFDWRLWRESRGYSAAGSQYALSLLYSAAMLYMFTALAKPSSGGSVTPGMTGMPGMVSGSSGGPSLRAPTLALVFTVLLVAFTVRDVDRPAGSAAGARTVVLAPAAVKGRRVMLGVIMAFMLIILM